LLLDGSAGSRRQKDCVRGRGCQRRTPAPHQHDELEMQQHVVRVHHSQIVGPAQRTANLPYYAPRQSHALPPRVTIAELAGDALMGGFQRLQEFLLPPEDCSPSSSSSKRKPLAAKMQSSLLFSPHSCRNDVVEIAPESSESVLPFSPHACRKHESETALPFSPIASRNEAMELSMLSKPGDSGMAVLTVEQARVQLQEREVQLEKLRAALSIVIRRRNSVTGVLCCTPTRIANEIVDIDTKRAEAEESSEEMSQEQQVALPLPLQSTAPTVTCTPLSPLQSQCGPLSPLVPLQTECAPPTPPSPPSMQQTEATLHESPWKKKLRERRAEKAIVATPQTDETFCISPLFSRNASESAAGNFESVLSEFKRRSSTDMDMDLSEDPVTDTSPEADSCGAADDEDDMGEEDDVDGWSVASDDSFNPEEMFGSGVYHSGDEEGEADEDHSAGSGDSESSGDEEAESTIVPPLSLNATKAERVEAILHEQNQGNFFSSETTVHSKRAPTATVTATARRMSATAAP